MAIDDAGDEFGMFVQARTPVSAQRVCEMMQQALQELVVALELRRSLPVRRLDVLPATERDLLQVAWNATQANYPADRCVHELFEERVEASPEAVALVCEAEVVSYRALNERANRLAFHLRQRGVGPDVRVALCLE